MRGTGYSCPKCKATFRDAYNLRRHQARKRTCEPIIDPPAGESAGKPLCRFCGRSFSTATAMYRHVRSRCKIANTSEGMDQLMDRTYQRQMAEQKLMTAQLQAQVGRLTELLEQRLALAPRDAAPAPARVETHNSGPTQVNTGPVTQATVINHVNIRSWVGEDRILLPASMLRAAFTEVPRLVEYCRLGDAQKVDAALAAPYVVEALVELVKRAHAADPASRNVYLNPRRADQVMVYDESWKVLPLVEAISALFDGVAGRIHEIIVTDGERKQLPLDVQAAAAWVPNLYEDDRSGYVERAKGPMSAHLTNLRAAVGAAGHQ